MTLLATQIGGGALLGASEEAFMRGWGVIFYPLGMVLGLAVLGLGYGAKMRKLNLTTVPEIFEKVYGSVNLRQIASLLSIASLFLILVGQGIAARKFFATLGFHGDLLFTLFWCILIAYTALGGLAAAAKTEIFQAAFIILTLCAALIAVTWSGVPETPLAVSSNSVGETPWLSWLLLPLFFMLIEQDMGQWCFAAKSPRTVSFAALIASVVLMSVSLIPIFFGTLAGKQGLEVEKGTSVLIAAVQFLTNPTIATFVICAVLMAIISTANSLLCSVSSNIVCDFKALNQSVAGSQLITLLVGVSTLLLAFVFDNVVSILMFSYELAVCVLFVPVTRAVWSKNPSKRSAAVSMAVGTLSFIVLKIGSTPLPKELVSLGLSFIAFETCQWLFPQRKKEQVLDNVDRNG